jgi:uncharacterized protein YoxC
MEIAQLNTTNVILGVIATVAILQMLALLLAVLWAKRALDDVSKTVARFEAERVLPLLIDARQIRDQARELITDVHQVVRRVTTLADGVQLRTRRAFATVEAANDRVDAVVNTGLNELHAIEVGVRQGLSAFVRGFRS